MEQEDYPVDNRGRRAARGGHKVKKNLIRDCLDPERLVLMDPLPDIEEILIWERHVKWVYAYIVHENGSEASRQAGYEGDHANNGWRNLKREDVRAALAVERERIRRKYSISVDNICKAFSAIGFSDLSDYQEVESVRDLRKLPPHMRQAVQELQTTTRTDKDGNKTTETRIRMHSKPQALENLAKFLGMFNNETPPPSVTVIIEK